MLLLLLFLVPWSCMQRVQPIDWAAIWFQHASIHRWSLTVHMAMRSGLLWRADNAQLYHERILERILDPLRRVLHPV